MSQWLKSAPPYLICALESGRGVHANKDLLAKLLTDDLMLDAWPEITRVVTRDQQWDRIWQQIRYAKRKAGNDGRVPERRSDEKKRFDDIAKRLSNLAVEIENTKLDVLVYELLDDETRSAMRITEWPNSPLERDRVARSILPEWPSAPELLVSLSGLAINLAKQAMTRERPDAARSGDVQVRTFAYQLTRDFRDLLGAELELPVARISSIVLEKSVKDDYVIEMVRDMNKKSRGKMS